MDKHPKSFEGVWLPVCGTLQTARYVLTFQRKLIAPSSTVIVDTQASPKRNVDYVGTTTRQHEVTAENILLFKFTAV